MALLLLVLAGSITAVHLRVFRHLGSPHATVLLYSSLIWYFRCFPLWVTLHLKFAPSIARQLLPPSNFHFPPSHLFTLT